MRKIAIIFFILTIASCGTASYTVKKGKNPYRAHLRMGVSFLATGNYRAALSSLLKAKKLRQDDPQLFNALGLAYLGLGALKDAEAAFQKAIELKPDFSEAHNNLGVVYSNMGLYHLAIKEFHRALKNLLYSTPEQALVNLGWAHYKLGEYIKAENYTKQALLRNPRMCVARKNLGLIYWAEGRLMDAETQLKKAIYYCPNYTEAHFNLGLLYLKINRKKDAYREFKKVTKIAPDSPLAEEAEKYLRLLGG